MPTSVVMVAREPRRANAGKRREASPLRGGLLAVVMGLVALPISVGAAADSTRHNLNPGVMPGDVVIMRRVEPAPAGSVSRHGGPIPSRVNARDPGMEVQGQLTGGGFLALSDEQAAGVRSSGLGTPGHNQGYGSAINGAGLQGERAMGASNRAAGSLGGGSGVGGITGQVTSATSGISNTIGQALSPFTSGGQ